MSKKEYNAPSVEMTYILDNVITGSEEETQDWGLGEVMPE